MDSLRSRIFGLFLVLMLAVLTLVLVLVYRSTYTHSIAQIQEQLVSAQRVFGNELESRRMAQQQLTETVARDYGLKDEVVGGADNPESLQVALDNYRVRSRAQVALVTGADGRVLASTTAVHARGSLLPFQSLLEDASSNDGLRVEQAALYQFNATPIHAPRPVVIGWLLLGFTVDDGVLRHLSRLTGATVSLLQKTPATTHLLASSSSGEPRAALSILPDLPEGGSAVVLDGHALVVHQAHLTLMDGSTVTVLLQRSLSEALADFRPLQWQLGGIVLFALALSGGGAFLVANSVSRPLAGMVEYVRRTGAGDYAAQPPVASGREVGLLAREFVAMQRGIAEREEAIRYAAFHDALTGLPNRSLFQQQAAAVLSAPRQRRCAVLLLDLDHFSEINDTLGHIAGDQLLDQVAKRLAAGRRERDLLARLGGDQFAFLLTEIDAREAIPLTLQYRELCLAPFEIEGISMEIESTAGIALFPDHGEQVGTLLQRAEVAMYLAKGKHQPYVVYNPQQDRHSLLRLTLMSELRGAIERGELTLYVQPKLDIALDRVIGVECLVRWIHPQHGFIPPDEFIPLAEQTGNVRHLTTWVLEAAWTWASRWQRAGVMMKTAVNLSAVDLLDPALPERVAAGLQRHGVPAASMVFEVTESAVMHDPAKAVAVLGQLRELGVRLSIDDYGTGYSSMAQLKRLRVHELKIDKAFVTDVADNEDDAVIVRSTIELGHNMGLRVVAEGVENLRALERLREFGCDQAQGYFIAKPMPAAEFIDWLAARVEVAVTPTMEPT